MEKIFKDCRRPILDNGFSDNVMRHIAQHIPEPRRTTYRVPTLIASVCTAAAIAAICLTVDINDLTKKYEQLVVNYQTSQYEKYAEYDSHNEFEEFDEFDEKKSHKQTTDFQDELENY